MISGRSMLRGLCSGEALFVSAFLWVCYDLPAIEYAAMPLLQRKASHRFRLCLVNLRTSLVFLGFTNQLFPQSYNSCFQYSVPLRLLPLLFSAVSTQYSSRYLCQRLPHNIGAIVTNSIAESWRSRRVVESWSQGIVESWSQGIVESWSPGIVESRAIRQPAVSFLTAIHSPNPFPSPSSLSRLYLVLI